MWFIYIFEKKKKKYSFYDIKYKVIGFDIVIKNLTLMFYNIVK